MKRRAFLVGAAAMMVSSVAVPRPRYEMDRTEWHEGRLWRYVLHLDPVGADLAQRFPLR